MLAMGNEHHLPQQPLVGELFLCMFEEADAFFRFMDKTGRTGTRMQAINGGFLLSAFFFVRMMYGGYIVSLLLTF